MTTGSNNKTVLVTGASGGIGDAICRQLIGKGHRVIAAGRNMARLDRLSADLGAGLHPISLDVTDPVSVNQMVSSLPNGFDSIDVLINNAGHDVGGRRAFHEGSADQWCDIVETNVQGTIRVTHVIVEVMRRLGRGHIVNIGSIVGLKPYATGSAYVTSKYAVHGFSETLRLDYAGKGIRVTEIMPGLVRSGFAEKRLGSADKAKEFYDSFEACLRPEDVAETVCFAIEQAPHVEIAQLVVLPVHRVKE